jgi:hypothetical protein
MSVYPLPFELYKEIFFCPSFKQFEIEISEMCFVQNCDS